MPFETMDQVARGLCEEIEHANQTWVVKRAAESVRIGCETLQRLELDVLDGEEIKQSIHIYEGYWAPLTEGVAKLRHVVRFLLSGAFNGLRSDAVLHRYMFGKPRTFDISRGSLTLLSAVIITLIAVLIIGGTISGGGILRLFLPHHDLVNDDVLRELTALFELLLGVIGGAAAVAIVIVLISHGLKKKNRARMSALTVLPVFVVVLAVCLSGYVGIPLIIACNEKPLLKAHLCACYAPVKKLLEGGLPETWGWAFLIGATVVLLVLSFANALRKPKKGSRNKGLRPTALVLSLVALIGVLALWGHSDALAFVTWLLLLGAVMFVRSFLIQYVGDVAIYVSPHVVDTFFDLRIRIRSTVWRAARAVYACPDGEDQDRFLYDDVVVVGHSLGAVVVYDVLNRLINDDGFADRPTPANCPDEPLQCLEVCKRTRLLLTFGAPLDKTAFIFAQHKLQSGSERDTLAASIQPLICAERTFDWVNLYSWFDILGGHLDYYDTPDEKDEPNLRRVCNEVDPDAITPFAAHTEFWNNQLLYKKMYDVLRA
ncbi:MAG TPA: hypothetical protein VKB93_26790 [Thermoanaerobaculia bacterium]|nr:hypothetical protein [Thermoanaerobaculia bacterium]